MTPFRMVERVRLQRASRWRIPLHTTITSAVAVMSRAPGGRGGFEVTADPDRHYPKMVEVLRGKTDFGKRPPQAKPDLQIIVQPSKSVAMGTWRRYDYVSATGELGTGDEWCKVPEEFRLWILEMKTAYTRHESPFAP